MSNKTEELAGKAPRKIINVWFLVAKHCDHPVEAADSVSKGQYVKCVNNDNSDDSFSSPSNKSTSTNRSTRQSSDGGRNMRKKKKKESGLHQRKW